MPTIDFSQGVEVISEAMNLFFSGNEHHANGGASRGVRRSVSSSGKREFCAGKPALRGRRLVIH